MVFRCHKKNSFDSIRDNTLSYFEIDKQFNPQIFFLLFKKFNRNPDVKNIFHLTTKVLTCIHPGKPRGTVKSLTFKVKG